MEKFLIFKKNLPYDVVIRPQSENIIPTILHFESDEIRDNWINKNLQSDESGDGDYKKDLDNLPMKSFIVINPSRASVSLSLSADYYKNMTINKILNSNFAVSSEGNNLYFWWIASVNRITLNTYNIMLVNAKYFTVPVQNIFSDTNTMSFERCHLDNYLMGPDYNIYPVLSWNSELNFYEGIDISEDMQEVKSISNFINDHEINITSDTIEITDDIKNDINIIFQDLLNHFVTGSLMSNGIENTETAFYDDNNRDTLKNMLISLYGCIPFFTFDYSDFDINNVMSDNGLYKYTKNNLSTLSEKSISFRVYYNYTDKDGNTSQNYFLPLYKLNIGIINKYTEVIKEALEYINKNSVTRSLAPPIFYSKEGLDGLIINDYNISAIIQTDDSGNYVIDFYFINNNENATGYYYGSYEDGATKSVIVPIMPNCNKYYIGKNEPLKIQPTYSKEYNIFADPTLPYDYNREVKLFYAPFSFIEVKGSQQSKYNFHYEKLNDNPDPIDVDNFFNYWGYIKPLSNIYKIFYSEGLYNQYLKNGYNYHEENQNCFNTVDNVFIDQYITNSPIIEQNLKNSVASGATSLIGDAFTGAIAGGLAGLAGGPTALVSAGIGAVAGLAKGIAGLVVGNTLQQSSNQASYTAWKQTPNKMESNGNNMLIDYATYNDLKASLVEIGLMETFKKQIGQLFQKFGNVFLDQDTFKNRFNTRYYYNYIKASNVLGAIKAELSQSLKQEIISDFAQGVTIWHIRADNWDDIIINNFDVNNVEMAIYERVKEKINGNTKTNKKETS